MHAALVWFAVSGAMLAGEPGGIDWSRAPTGDASIRLMSADLPQAEPPAVAVEPIEPLTLAAPSSEPLPADDEFYTRAEISAELKKLPWTKDAFKVTPYGILWATTAYETQRSRITDYCLYIESPAVQGEPAFIVDYKSTRFGLDVVGPSVPRFGDAKLGGKVEVDLQGRFVTRNKPDLLLRHAYLEIRSDEYRLLAGQTWDVISPLGMPILNYTAGSAVGNLAYRRAQFRGERFLALSDDRMLTLQGALAADILGDFTTDPFVSADQGSYPHLQGRVAYTLGRRDGPNARPVVIGLSSHIGESVYDFLPPLPNPADDVARRSWSFSVDFTIPLNERCGLQGEWFTGENLSGYFAGVLQGVNRVTYQPIRANGGWTDFYFDLTPRLHTHWGFAIDDPLDQDMSSGRTYNQVAYTNVGYDITKLFNVAMEIGYWKTGWMDLPRGEAVRLEIAARYRF
jgi:hypothetical protein